MSLGPAVLDGVVRYLSPSAMEKLDPTSYGGCERRWWYRYVNGTKEKQRRSQKLGTQVHSQLEHHLRTGEPVLGEIALAGRRFLPAHGPDLLLEHAFGEHCDANGLPIPEDSKEIGRVTSPVRAGTIPVIGRIDVMHRRGTWIDDEGAARPDPGAAEVVDWKTTKRIDNEVDEQTGIVVARGLAKTADALGRTWQMVAYGKCASRRWPDLAHVRLSHGYFQSEGQRAASKRSALLTVAEVDERWDAPAAALAERAKRVAQLKVVQEVPANLDACRAFGGCPHREYCPRDARAAMLAIFGSGGTMGLADRMKARREAEAKGQPVADAAQVAAPLAGAVAGVGASSAEVKAEIEKLKQEERGAAVLPPDVPAPSKVAEVPAESAAPAGCCPHSENTRKLTIDDVASKKWTCPSCGESLKVKPKKLDDGYYALVPRHGEKKAEETKKVADAIATVAAADPSTSTAAVESASPDPSSEHATGLVLYLDAGEDGVRSERLERYAEQLCRDLEAQYKCADVRCASNDTPLGFGKWRGALAAYARSSPPPAGAYECSASSEVGLVVFEALVPVAGRVVRKRG